MEKINITKLLKDCPSGMELDCTMYEDVYFDYVDELNIIHCYIQYETHKTSITFNQFGTPNSNIKSKCVIFPKGKTTWEGFVPPCQFKDGDVIVCENHWGPFISIFKENVTARNGFIGHCVLDVDDIREFKVKDSALYFNKVRFATKIEKEQLFRAIERNGYKWNAETKILEKLSTDKFDINTLVPFESRVLVRNDEHQYWIPAFWGCKRTDGYTTTFGWCKYCIPFEGNEHLLETNNDCDEYFKTWK